MSMPLRARCRVSAPRRSPEKPWGLFEGPSLKIGSTQSLLKMR
jgi:hypothetical protein